MPGAFGTFSGDHSRTHALSLVKRVVGLRGPPGASAAGKSELRSKLERIRAEELARRLRHSGGPRPHAGPR